MATLPQTFAQTVAAHGNDVALRWKDGDAFREWTWNDYADRVGHCRRRAPRLGVGRGDRVVLMLRNRPEFHVADTATALLGATPVSIYNSSAPEQIEYLVGHSEASVAIVEDIGFLERFLKVRSELPNLRHVVIVDDPDGSRPDDIRAVGLACSARRPSTSTPSSGNRATRRPR